MRETRTLLWCPGEPMPKIGLLSKIVGQTDEEHISWLWAGGSAFLLPAPDPFPPCTGPSPLSPLHALPATSTTHHDQPRGQKVVLSLSVSVQLFVCSATWIFLRRSTACYCWTPQTAHCCGRGGGTGRLLTNSWRRRRFGLFSTQHSSRTHLAHPLLLFTKTRWICHQHFQCHPGMTVSIASLSESLWGQISPACMNRMFLTFPESTAPCCQQTIVLISWAIAMNLYSSDKGVLMWKRAYFCSQKQSLS